MLWHGNIMMLLHQTVALMQPPVAWQALHQADFNTSLLPRVCLPAVNIAWAVHIDFSSILTDCGCIAATAPADNSKASPVAMPLTSIAGAILLLSLLA